MQIVPDPNLNKRINDNGIELRWYDNVRSPFETSLVEIIEKRASLVGFDAPFKELWYEWFPRSVDGLPSFEFVIQNTRYLPRDLISFFREMQKLGKKPPFDRIDVLSALNNYSDWFLQELSDALVGLINENIRIELPHIISDLGYIFSFKDLKNKLEEYGFIEDENSAENIAREMFNTSWIGNRWYVGNKIRYAWRHRKLNSKINLRQEMVVHKGLRKALNLI